MAASMSPWFKVGAKELYLPNAQITLLRMRNQHPNHARFHVPLWFSKLDLRDYLWHAYGVETYGVRSYVKLSPVRARSGNQARRWHRKRSRKFMTVDLVHPFVWPEPVEDLSSWHAKTMPEADKSSEKWQEKFGSKGDTLVNEERRERMKEQARALLEGKVKWKPAAQRMAPTLYSKQQ